MGNSSQPAQNPQYQNQGLYIVNPQPRPGNLYHVAPPQYQNQNQGFQRRPAPGSTQMAASPIRPQAYIDKSSALLTYPQGYYLINFQVTTKVASRLSISFFIQDNPDSPPSLFTFHPIYINLGVGTQMISQAIPDISHIPPQVLFFRDRKTYPIVVELTPMIQILQSHTTYFSFNRQGGNLGVKPVRQRFMHQGRYMELMDAYGLADQEDNECVVCMSNPRNTAIQPCMHVCVCDECSEMMRRHQNSYCPVCRGPVRNFKKFNLN